MQALPTSGAFMEWMASWDSGSASLCTGYPPIVTQETNCLHPVGNLILRYVKVAIASWFERSCHRRKRTEAALKPRIYVLSWKLSELSSHTSLPTLTDKWQYTEKLYHHLPQACGPVHILVACWAYTTITQFKPQGVGPNWSLHTSLLTTRCMAMGDKGHEWGQ